MRDIMGQSNELPRLVFHVFGTRGVRQTPPLREEESGDGMHSELYIKAAGFLLIQTHTHKLSMLTMKAAPPPQPTTVSLHRLTAVALEVMLETVQQTTQTHVRLTVCRIRDRKKILCFPFHIYL